MQLLRLCQQAFSFASPKAILNALLPKPQPAASSGGAQQAERVAAFRRFIESVERRSGGEQVPEFPAGAQWFNAPPLQLARYAVQTPQPLLWPLFSACTCLSRGKLINFALPDLPAWAAKLGR